MEIKLVRKLTDFKWLNLFNATYVGKDNKVLNWIFASRKDNPLREPDSPDAVIIVPFIARPGTEGRIELVLTSEYRVPIADFEISFPAGLIEKGEQIKDTVRREMKEETGLEVLRILYISPPTYSSAGCTDESTVFCFVQIDPESKVNKSGQEDEENITTFIVDHEKARKILADTSVYRKKISSKAYPILLSFARDPWGTYELYKNFTSNMYAK